MVKAKAIKEFTLKDFDELKSLERAVKENNEKGKIYENDTFICEDWLAKYLSGENDLNISVIEILEVIPEKKEEKPKKTTNKKKK